MKEKMETEEEGYKLDTGRGIMSGVPFGIFPVVSEMARLGSLGLRWEGAVQGRLWLSHREPQLVPRQERPAVEELGLVVHYLPVLETFSERL